MKEGWFTCTISDICIFNYGSGLSEKKRRSGKIPVYGSNGIIGYHDEALVHEPGIIIGRKGTLGKVFFSKVPFYPIDTTFYITTGKDYHLQFLYYLLRTLGFEKKSTDSAVPGLNRELAYGTPILLPPLFIQHRIAEILGALDDKIECNRRINKTLEQMAMVLYKHWFLDFGPFRGGEFVDSEVGPIPKGWKIQSLYESAIYINGAAFKGSDFSPDKSGLPIIKISELKYGISAQTEFCNLNLDPKYQIVCGDILFSWSGSPDTSIDIFLWAGTVGWLNQHTFKVIANNQFERCFVFYLLKYLKPTFIEIARNKQTTGLGHVTIQDMKRIKVVSPNYEIIEKFNGLVEPLFNQVLENKKEENTLTHIRDRLLPKLLSGEIEVKELDKEIN